VPTDPRPWNLRALPAQAADRVRAMVDGALDRIFDEPFDVRSADELERLYAEGPIGGGIGPAATSLTGFVAAATPIARRAWAMASRSSKIAAKAPLPSSKAVRIGLASIPIALRLGGTGRRGMRELQLLASYVMTCFRRAGVPADRGLVRAITLSVYVDPARRPTLDAGGSRWAGAISRQWILRSLGGDGERAIRDRARSSAAAVERLDLSEFATAWSRRDVIDL
jgi:hypothetical protein